MIDNRETTYSHHALARMAEHGAAVVICGQDHHPVAMCLPISKNSALQSRLDAQLSVSKPATKRLWKQVVSAKIRAQADALIPCTGAKAERVRMKLMALATRVRSGDPDNLEAQAAAAYWPVLFADCPMVKQPFRRSAGDRAAEPPNNLLDYGYAGIRAAIARAIVGAGLLPAVGIMHRGRSNPFCLADDLMEPFRPLVDTRARWLSQRGEFELTQAVKAELLGVLTDQIGPAGSSGPLMVVMSRYVASFVRVLTGEDVRLDVPDGKCESNGNQ